MIVKLVYDNRRKEIFLPPELLPPEGKHAHHFHSTPLDQLTEICGRACYDSAKQAKNRSSEEYHKHIDEVKHTSLWRHCFLTFKMWVGSTDIANVYRVMANRPGTFLNEEFGLGGSIIYITINLCAIMEWDKFTPELMKDSGHTQELFAAFAAEAKKQAPLVTASLEVPKISISRYVIESTLPILDREVYISLFLSGISRNATHEYIRHCLEGNPSQRSTRYVDEDGSEFIEHPVYQRYKNKLAQNLVGGLPEWQGHEILDDFYGASRYLYRKAVDCFQDCLIQDGLDKFSARKQARGAARGFLPSCLATEMIYTGSIYQYKEIIRQRASPAADEEIRQLADQIHSLLRSEFPGSFC